MGRLRAVIARAGQGSRPPTSWQGYSRLARENYYEKMRALAQRYDFALIEFEDHDEDPTFLDAQHTHLTQEGWLFYDRALDDFFHGRVPRS